MALFASHGSSGRSSSKNLVEFRAGKMTLTGTMVNPDKRKGLVYVYQSTGDGLMHFCWKDRTSGKVEDDLIIFPEDCEFKRISQCTTGRVYLLKFKSSTKKHFFWMQEPKTDKDDDRCKKINDIFNNPPSVSQGSDGGLEHLGHGNLQDVLQGMDNNQFLQLMAAGGGMSGLSSLLSGAGGRQRSSQSSTRSSNRTATSTVTSDSASSSAPAASATPTPAVATPAPSAPKTPTPSTPGLQLSQLQNILSDMGVAKDGASRIAVPEAVDLTKVLKPSEMAPILTNPEVQERLKPFLPEGEELPSTSGQLQDTVSSPQFRQALSSFGEALATGQLGPVLQQFNLPPSAQEAATKGDVQGFAKAMQESKSDSKSPNDKKGKDDDDDKMVVE